MKAQHITSVLVVALLATAVHARLRDVNTIADLQQKQAPTLKQTPTLTPYFSPDGGAQAAVIREIDQAKLFVRVQAYSFTSAPIASALVRAHKRGVKVRAVLDKSNRTARYSSATFLANAGVPVLIDAKHAIAHSKIVDGETLLTGSFNFSRAAEERNAENLLVIKNAPALLNAYNGNFSAHAAHSLPYARENSATLPQMRVDALTTGTRRANLPRYRRNIIRKTGGAL